MALQLHIRQGRGGRWRWFLEKDGKHRALSGIRGYATEQEAIDGALEDLGDSVECSTEESYYYAGRRDFSD